MRQLKITKSITNRESASLDKYLQEIGREELISVDEEVELYIPCRGENGCPSSIDDSVKDAKWKKEQIEKLIHILLDML